MAAITWANVIDHAPGLSTVDTDAQNDILAYVNTALKVDEFYGEASPMLKLARIYLAAHMGTMIAQAVTGQVGPVQAESVGGVSRAYAVAQFAQTSSLADTTWGRAFLQLVRVSPARAPIVL